MKELEQLRRGIMQQTKVIAHRGSKGTHPENTLAAFQEALRVESDGIELDLHLTKDQQLVVIHDESVNRTTNGKGKVKDMTLYEIKQLDAGSSFSPAFKDEKIPSFQEVLDLLVKEDFKGLLNIELKTDHEPYPGIEEKVIQIMKQHKWLFQVVYSSFNYDSLIRMKERDYEAEIALLFEKSKGAQKKIGEKYTICMWHPKINWLKRVGLKTYPHQSMRPWTINSLSQMDYCFEQAMSGLITDYPELALKRRKKWQPDR